MINKNVQFVRVFYVIEGYSIFGTILNFTIKAQTVVWQTSMYKYTTYFMVLATVELKVKRKGTPLWVHTA